MNWSKKGGYGAGELPEGGIKPPTPTPNYERTKGMFEFKVIESSYGGYFIMEDLAIEDQPGVPYYDHQHFDSLEEACKRAEELKMSFNRTTQVPPTVYTTKR